MQSLAKDERAIVEATQKIAAMQEEMAVLRRENAALRGLEVAGSPSRDAGPLLQPTSSAAVDAELLGGHGAGHWSDWDAQLQQAGAGPAEFRSRRRGEGPERPRGAALAGGVLVGVGAHSVAVIRSGADFTADYPPAPRLASSTVPHALARTPWGEDWCAAGLPHLATVAI